VDLSDVLEAAEQLKILNTLGRLTVHGTISWRPDGADGSVTEVGTHRYQLSSVDGDGLPPYRLSVYRKQRTGQPTYLIVAQVVMRTSTDPKSNAEINGTLRELYEDAYRKSRRKASKIDEFMNELEEAERGDIAPF
jgi:hypothetical protein